MQYINDSQEFKYQQFVKLNQPGHSCHGRAGRVMNVSHRSQQDDNDLRKRYLVLFGSFPSTDEYYFFADDLQAYND